MIDIKKTYKTRDGRSVRLISDQGPEMFPIVGYINEDLGPSAWDGKGSYYADGTESSLDLIEVKPEPEIESLLTISQLMSQRSPGELRITTPSWTPDMWFKPYFRDPGGWYGVEQDGYAAKYDDSKPLGWCEWSPEPRKIKISGWVNVFNSQEDRPMKVFTIKDIRELDPCYDPAEFLSEDWQGTVLDILRVTDCPAEDRIWVASQLVSSRVARLFACACAEEDLKLQSEVSEVDPRSLAAVEVARRYALGQAAEGELGSAERAAWSVFACAAWSVDRSASWSAFACTARSAVWAVAACTTTCLAADKQLDLFAGLIEAYEGKP